MSTTNPRNVIVLVVDRLGAGFWGPYGNTWLETPAANRLAAESMLVDFAITDSVDLSEIYTSYWTGSHRLDRRRTADTPPTWLNGPSLTGVSTWLLTDEERVAYHPLAAQFQHRDFHPLNDVTRAATNPESAGMMRSFARWMARLETLRPPFLAWIHARGMDGSWDAPYEYRRQVADPDDPPPPTDVAVPAFDVRGQDADPDRLWGWTCAYGAQVMLFDECLDIFRQFLHVQRWGRETTLVVTSPRGFPLGEHGVVGDAAECLFNEAVHVPLAVRGPLLPSGERTGSMLRVQPFAQPADLGRWIKQGDLWGTGALDPCHALARMLDRSPHAVQASILGTEKVSLRNHHWSYIGSLGAHDSAGGQLFVKPDDRWDFNDVALRAPDDLRGMQSLVADLLRADPG